MRIKATLFSVVLAVVGMSFLALGETPGGAHNYPGSCTDTVNCVTRSGKFVQQTPQTPATLNLYVSADGGIDTRACTSWAAACATVQGAVGKVPAFVTVPTEINLDVGTYAGAWVEGFTFNRTPNVATTASAWLRFTGQLVTATAATGSATGTATAGSKGAWSDGTVNTVTVSGAGWTADNFKGKLITFTGGHNVGSSFPIITNSATVISFGDNPGQVPAAGDTFTVQDWGTLVDQGTPIWNTPSGYFDTYFANFATFTVFNTGAQTENIAFQNLRFRSNASTEGVQFGGPTSASFKWCKFDGSNNFNAIIAESLVTLLLLDNVFVPNNGGHQVSIYDDQAIGEHGGGHAIIQSQGNLIYGSVAAGKNGIWISADDFTINSQYDYGKDLDRLMQYGKAALFVTHNIVSNFNIAFSSTNSITTLSPGGQLWDDLSYYASGASEPFNITGRGSSWIDHITGTGNANGLSCTLGALCRITANTGFGTVSGSELLLDTANYSLATLRAANPTMEVDAKWGSRVVQ